MYLYEIDVIIIKKAPLIQNGTYLVHKTRKKNNNELTFFEKRISYFYINKITYK